MNVVHMYTYKKIIESQLNTWRHSISGCQLWSSNLKTSIETQILFLWVQYNWVKFENHGEEREYVDIKESTETVHEMDQTMRDRSKSVRIIKDFFSANNNE